MALNTRPECSPKPTNRSAKISNPTRSDFKYHHHHHFHYASAHLSSTPDSKLTFSINPSLHSLPHLFGQLSRIFMTISGLNCSSVFLSVLLFSSLLFDACDRLSWFISFWTARKITALSFTFLSDVFRKSENVGFGIRHIPINYKIICYCCSWETKQ